MDNEFLYRSVVGMVGSHLDRNTGASEPSIKPATVESDFLRLHGTENTLCIPAQECLHAQPVVQKLRVGRQQTHGYVRISPPSLMRSHSYSSPKQDGNVESEGMRSQHARENTGIPNPPFALAKGLGPRKSERGPPWTFGEPAGQNADSLGQPPLGYDS